MTGSTKAIEEGSMEEASWRRVWNHQWERRTPPHLRRLGRSLFTAPLPLHNEHMSPESLALVCYAEVLEPTPGRLGVFFPSHGQAHVGSGDERWAFSVLLKVLDWLVEK